MIGVFAVAAVLASVVVLYVVFGARRHRAGGMDRNGANAALFVDRRRELIDEGRIQALDSSTLAELEEELALDLIEADVPASDSPAGSGSEAGPDGQPETGQEESEDVRRQHIERARPSVRVVGLAAAAMALVALGLYAFWGEPHAPELLSAADVLAGDGLDPADLARAEESLSAYVARNPEDANSWFLLGHSRMRLSDYRGAEQAFATLRDLAGSNEEVDAAWVQASYLTEGRLNAAAREVAEAVLGAHPDHPAMLEMLAMDAMRRGGFAEASGYLARATGQPLPESRRRLLDQLMTFVQSQLDPARPLIEVSVRVEGRTRRPWLMVFARPVTGGMPLAVVRRRAETSQTVLLDDTVGMGTGPPLSTGGLVEVVARLSETGNAAASEDDLEVSTQPLDPRAQPRVELVFQGDKAAGMATTIVDVSLDPAFDIAPGATVFVIARDAEQPGPPVAVKRLTAGELPARVELTDADAMLPDRGLNEVGTLELVARVALGGSASAVAGDIESAPWVGHPTTEPIRLHLDRRLP